MDDGKRVSRQIAGWIDDIAGHAQAADAIGALGAAAVPGLRAYLAGGPQVVPQPRCFAVTMLARLPAAASTGSLREVLRDHPLASLSPMVAGAEYVVKSYALDALCARAYPERAQDIAFGVHERLRTAVAASGRFGLTHLSTALVDVLDDDVLADEAMAALGLMGPIVGRELAPRLDTWLIAARGNARRRLALIRALRVLHQVGPPERSANRQALEAQHPAVRAAAALTLWPSRCDGTVIEHLLHGALGFDRGLADDCRTALEAVGAVCVEPVRRALQRNAEPDLYGDVHPLSSEQRGWLNAYLQHCLQSGG